MTVLVTAILTPVGRIAPTPIERRRVVATVSVAASLAAGLGLIALVVTFAHRLPVLILGLDTSAMTRSGSGSWSPR